MLVPTAADGGAAAAAPAAAAADAGAVQLVSESTLSLTLEPIKGDTDAARLLSSADVHAARHEACQAALDSFDALYAAWERERYLAAALAFEEFGSLKEGAHLQTSWTVRSSELENKQIEQQLDKRLRAHLKQPQYTANGKVKWTFRKLHVHTDPKLLAGYCVKQHTRYNFAQHGFAQCPMKRVGAKYTDDYLKLAYLHWLETVGGNESGHASLSVEQPGQADSCPTMTRARWAQLSRRARLCAHAGAVIVC